MEEKYCKLNFMLLPTSLSAFASRLCLPLSPADFTRRFRSPPPRSVFSRYCCDPTFPVTANHGLRPQNHPAAEAYRLHSLLSFADFIRRWCLPTSPAVYAC